MMKKTDFFLRNIELLLMVPTVGVLAGGTVVERFHDNDFARSHIYGSWWFIILLSLFGLYSLWRLVCELRRKDSRVGKSLYKLLLYASVIFILVGGLLTMTTGQHGSMKLSPGVAASSYVTDDGETVPLPFSMTLGNFELIPYPGTNSPMDFVSHVSVDGEAVDISMNNIYRRDGYRFYQEDYDVQGNSTLSVAHDPWGIGFTYTGYILMALGIIAMFVSPRSRFRRLLRNAVVVAIVFIFQFSFINSATAAPRTLPKATADKMGQIYVLYKGRVCPLQTMAKDFTTKLCGSARYKGLTPEQVLGGWLFYNSEWVEEPMIKVKGDDVRQLFKQDGCSSERCRLPKMVSFMQMLANDKQLGSQGMMSMMGGTLPSIGQMKSKTMRAASEKYNLVQMLIGGKFVRIYPLEDSAGVIGWYGQNDDLPAVTPSDDYFFVRKQLSYCQELVVKGDFAELEHVFEKTVDYQRKHADGILPSMAQYRAERLYNSLTTGRWFALMVLSLGLFFFARAIFRARRRNSYESSVDWPPLLIVVLVTLFLLLIVLLRWIAGGHAPMAGGFDSMNLMSVAIGIVGIALSHRYKISPSIALFSMGFCLLVAMMSGSNPPITHLMPVLSSPLLTLHVTVIMLSYALFFFVMLNGVAALVLRDRDTQMMRISQIMLYPAVALLSVGIAIGAIWANISWGNYWSWDPKEVWALITLIVYLFPLLSYGNGTRNKGFHLYCVFAFFSVIITYFGVNLILGGIHAYN